MYFAPPNPKTWLRAWCREKRLRTVHSWVQSCTASLLKSWAWRSFIFDRGWLYVI